MALDTQQKSAELAARLDRLPFSKWHRNLFVLCFLGVMFDACDFALFGMALPPVAREFGLNPAQAGLLATVGLVGAFLGALFWGTISDYIGRSYGVRFHDRHLLAVHRPRGRVLERAVARRVPLPLELRSRRRGAGRADADRGTAKLLADNPLRVTQNAWQLYAVRFLLGVGHRAGRVQRHVRLAKADAVEFRTPVPC